MAKLGDILRSLRVRENLTQDELARKLNVTRSAIGMYENNERTPKKKKDPRISPRISLIQISLWYF